MLRPPKLRALAPLLLAIAGASFGCATTHERCAARPIVSVPSYPPGPLPESKQKPPTPGMTWVRGEWTWEDARWVWTPGYWIASPNGGAWEPGRTWEEGGAIEFQRGGWECRELGWKLAVVCRQGAIVCWKGAGVCWQVEVVCWPMGMVCWLGEMPERGLVPPGRNLGDISPRDWSSASRATA